MNTPIYYSKKFLEKFGFVFEDLWKEQMQLYETFVLYNAQSKGSIDIRKVFQNTAEGELDLKKFAGDISISPNPDELIWKIADAVNEHLRYKRDINNYGRPEYWASPAETLNKGLDDCDGYAVLIKWLADYMGIPKHRTMVGGLTAYTGRITKAGDKVSFEGGRWGGHCPVLYRRVDDHNWYPVEGSLLKIEAKRNFDKRLPLLQNPRYRDVWWMTNQEQSYSKRAFSPFKGVTIK